MKKIRNSLMIIVLLSCNNGLGYSYQAVVASKIVNKCTKKRRFIVGLYDYHLKKHPANKSQRTYIDESLLKKCAMVKGKLIVEDLSSANNDGRMICCNFGINSAEGVLGKLANKARSMGIAVDNVEYRYCRVAGIGPLLNNIQVNPHSFRSSATINTISLYKEIIDEIEKIKKYDDGKLLNDVYKRTTATVYTALSKMGLNNKTTVADYCAKLPSSCYRQELEKLCIFDSALIDMNILHAIATSSDEQFIFIIAGGSHIEQVISVLQHMGYDLLLELKNQTSAVSTLKKVLNSDTFSASSDSHPQPIDISIIDKFIR